MKSTRALPLLLLSLLVVGVIGFKTEVPVDTQQSAVATVAPAPTVTLTATPMTVAPNGETVLSWTSTNARICSYFFPALYPVIDYQNVNGKASLAVPSNTTYSITCYNVDGKSVTKNVAVTVKKTLAAVTTPVIDFRAVPSTVPLYGTSSLLWNTTGAAVASCTGTGFSPGGNSSQTTIGASKVGPLSSSANYTITCKNAAGVAVSKSVSVVVDPTLPPMVIPIQTSVPGVVSTPATIPVPATPTTPTTPATPVITITKFSAAQNTVVYGGYTIVSWLATNATSCKTVPALVAGISGSAPIGPLYAPITYTITCTAPSLPTVTQSLTVTIGDSSAAAPIAPSGLNLTISSPSEVILRWQDNSNNEDGFLIERKLSNETTWRTLTKATVNSTYFIDPTVPTGLVSPLASVGTSLWSKVLALFTGNLPTITAQVAGSTGATSLQYQVSATLGNTVSKPNSSAVYYNDMAQTATLTCASVGAVALSNASSQTYTVPVGDRRTMSAAPTPTQGSSMANSLAVTIAQTEAAKKLQGMCRWSSIAVTAYGMCPVNQGPVANTATNQMPTVTFFVPAGQYQSTISQTDANTQAKNAAQAQANASLADRQKNGNPPYATAAQYACTPGFWNTKQTYTITTAQCPAQQSALPISVSVDANKYFSLLSQSDADAKAYALAKSQASVDCAPTKPNPTPLAPCIGNPIVVNYQYLGATLGPNECKVQTASPARYINYSNGLNTQCGPYSSGNADYGEDNNILCYVP